MMDAVFTYDLRGLEVTAYKLCLLWEQITAKELKGEYVTKLGKGDPRKCLLFKYCYKLARETQGIIEPAHYKLYIFAQIFTLKNLSDGKVHALIEPGCLVGEKAWKRWKIFKWRYDKAIKQQENQGENESIHSSENQVLAELGLTRHFLNTKLGEDYDQEKLIKTFADQSFLKWVSFSRISPYYLILSPLIRKNFPNLQERFSMDFSIYEKSITDKIREAFKLLFPVDQ